MTSAVRAGLLVAAVCCPLVLGPTVPAAAGPRVDEPSLAVTGATVLPDGRVAVHALVRCPADTGQRWSRWRVSASQGPAGLTSGGTDVDPAPCSGSRQRSTVVVASLDGQPFRPGGVLLSFVLETDCTAGPQEVACAGALRWDADVEAEAGARRTPVTPVLQVRRLRLLPDGQVDLRARVRCDRNRADDFSILQVSLVQTPTADAGEEVHPWACTGRRQSVRHRFASAAAPFAAGPARLFVQLLSDCREVPFDDGEGTHAICSRLTAYERPVVLG